MKSPNYSKEWAVAALQNVKERNYWLDKLSGDLVKSSFPYDYRKTGIEKRSFDTVKFGFAGDLYSSLMELSRGSDHALHIIMVSAAVVLLNKYTGRKDILVGAPIYKQKVAGEFINTVLVLRNQLENKMTFKELLYQAKRTIVAATEHQNYPVEILAEDLNIPVSADEFPLFDIIILLENIHNKEDVQHINSNLIFSFLRTGDSIEGIMEYNSLLYEKSAVERIISHFRNVLENAVSDPNIQVPDMDIFSEEEKKQFLFDFNLTETGYPKDKTINELFEEQAEKAPDKTAVLFEDSHLTYGELNKKANRFAHFLRKRGVVVNTIVGLMLERSLDMMVVIPGILKTGGAYLPIDTAFPKNRIRMMLNDCRASILLVGSTIFEKHSFVSLQELQEIRVKPHLTRKRPQIKDLDGLPIPDRSLVNFDKYNRYIGQALVKHCISLQATRGCPYKCIYCHKIWPKTHVVRSAENVFAELQLYYNMGVRRFAFIDDIFNLDVKNSTRFFKLIIENGMKLQLFFPNGLRGDIMTKEYIDLMVEAGAIDIAFALETASPRLQKLLKKNLNIKKLRENIEYISKRYPHVILELFTMHGFPTETKEEASMTLDFIKSLKWFHFAYVSILRIFPGTDMEKLAVESGVSRESIRRFDDFPFQELSDTLPFEKSFSLNYQADFFNNYFLSKERLLHVLKYQMKVLTEDELVQKYNSYVPGDINNFGELLQFLRIARDELGTGGFLDESAVSTPNLSGKMVRHFLAKETSGNGLRVLLLDLSQNFSAESDQLHDLIEPPLGLMYVLTYLNRQFGSKINGKIAKSQIDFDSYGELKTLLEDFKPGVIGIRTLSLYKDFFHKTVAAIRQWGFDVPIISGGPYATSTYETILQDRYVDLVVMGEGEVTFCEVIEKMLENGGKLPGEEILKEIEGIAFVPGKDACSVDLAREVIVIDSLREALSVEPGRNLAHLNRSGDLGYVIYTSGSTGRPKGTLTSHYNVNRVVRNTNYIDLTGNDRILQLSNYAFDGSVFDIYGALVNGSTLVMLKQEDVFLIDNLANIIIREGITVFFVTTALFNRLVEEKLECFTNVKKVLFGGEKVSVDHVRKALGYMGKGRIIHVYGPTETTVYASYYHVNEIDERLGTIPIGRPISNTTTYILDENMKPAPIGGYGELYIGGDGVARGYLNSVEFTAEKFIGNPFVEENCLYKTGDLVRWLQDGNIEFIDRVDQQIKIRGFRIELGEIETQLLKHNEIDKAAVLAVDTAELNRSAGKSFGETREKYLCAYIVSDKEPDAEELQEFLSRELPGYMIPSYFVQVEKIPLTPNGKVDKKTLPVPQIAGSEKHVAPRDEVEKKLAEIWSKVLEIKKESIGIDSNFYELGGHSLNATVILSRISKELYVKVPYTEIFVSPTIGELAEYIKKAKREKFISIGKAKEREYYALSAAQKRMYIQQQKETSLINYNIPIALLMEGKLEISRMEETIKKLVNRHESLRTSFEAREEGVVQKIHQEINFKLDYCDMSAKLDGDLERLEQGKVGEKLMRDFIRPFDLSQATLLRVKVIKIGIEKHLLLIDMHHIITDGTSMGIFVNEFMTLYEGKELARLSFQYKDFSEWQNNRIQSGELKKQEEYWLKQFESGVPALDLPSDYARPAVMKHEGSILSFEIDEEETQALKAMASGEDATLFMVVLAIYNVLLSKLSGKEDIVVATGISGRRHPDLESIIGMFVNTLALRNYQEGSKPFGVFLKQLKERTLEAYDNQDYQFEDIVKQVLKSRDLNRFPLCDVGLGFENIDIQELKIPGLKLRTYEFENRISKIDMALYTIDTGEKLNFLIEYCTELFKPGTIERFSKYFREIISAVIKNRNVKLKDIRISHDLFDQKIDNPRIKFDF